MSQPPPPLAIPGRFGVPNASGQKFNKACDPCHISKTRCIPDPLSPTSSCKRCSKNGSSCVFSPIGPRRRPVRSKNDRIVELERRVRDMQLKLERQVEKQQVERRAGVSNVPGSDADRDAPGPESFAEASASRSHQPHKPAPPFFLVPGSESTESKLDPTQSEPESSAYQDANKSLGGASSDPSTGDGHSSVAPDVVAKAPELKPARYGPDVVDRELITLFQADRLVNRFRQYIDGKFLGIGIPDDYTNQSLRCNKPAVWLSVLCAASTGSAEFLSLNSALSGEMEKLLDEQVQEDLEPDLEMIQALTIFYIFHNDFSESQRQRLCDCNTIVVAIVVRLGQASRIHNLPDGVPIAEADVTERDLDLSRQILIWHWCSFSLAVKARHDILIRPFNLVTSSLRILETSGSQCDMCLIEWTKLLQIVFEAAFALFNGHVERQEGLSDDERDGIIQSFEKKRRQWLINCPFDLVNEFLMLEYHYSALVLTEVIYPAGKADFQHRSHGLPSLSCPSLSPASADSDNTETKPDQDVLAPYRIQYTQKCITAAHACLALVISPPISPGLTSSNSLADPETLRYFANVPYSRLFYSLRFLLFVAHDIWRTGKYDLINIDSLRPGYYIEGLKRVLSVASDGGKFRPPTLWLYAIQTRIEPWWRSFRARLERDRPTPPSRSRSSGEVGGTPGATPPSASATPFTHAPEPRRQTSEPLPPYYDNDRAPASEDAQAPALVPYDIFSASQAMDFLIPFNFVQQAPPVAAAEAIRGNPNLGPQPFARTPLENMRAALRRQIGPSGAAYTIASFPPPPEKRRGTSLSDSTEDQTAAASAAAAEGSNLGRIFDHQLDGLGDLDDYLGTMDLDAFNFDWGDYGALFPGAEAFLPDSTVLPASSHFTGGGVGEGLGEDVAKG